MGCASSVKSSRNIINVLSAPVTNAEEANTLIATWNEHLKRDAVYSAVVSAIRRSAAIRQTVSIEEIDPEKWTEAVKKAVVDLSGAVRDFIGLMVESVKNNNIQCARTKAYELGARHVTYGARTHRFKPVFWEIFELSLTENLTNEEWATEEQVKVWQRFIRTVCRWMQEGYEDEKNRKK